MAEKLKRQGKQVAEAEGDAEEVEDEHGNVSSALARLPPASPLCLRVLMPSRSADVHKEDIRAAQAAGHHLRGHHVTRRAHVQFPSVFCASIAFLLFAVQT